ncbi:hypothetical protein [Corynebacterium bovis]|uniref:hypothetical protein n=1 Tax=Corynebacterium bovis TaxID=36808 RepID=UPI0031389448
MDLLNHPIDNVMILSAQQLGTIPSHVEESPTIGGDDPFTFDMMFVSHTPQLRHFGSVCAGVPSA